MKLYLRLLKYLKPYWKRLIVAMAAAIFVSLLTAAHAWLVKPVLDDIFINKNLFMLKILPAVLIIIAIFKGLFTYTQSYLMRYIGNRVILDIREDLYKHLIFIPIGFFTKNPTAKITSRVINDVGMIQNAVSSVVRDLLQNTVTVIALIGYLFYLDFKMASVSVLVIPISYYPILKLSKKLRKISKSGQEKIADLSAILQETFSGIKVIKAFRTEDFERERFRDSNLRYFKNSMKATRVSEITAPVMNLIGTLGVSLIIWYGGFNVINGTTTPGEFFSFMAACFMLYAPMRNFSIANNIIQQAISASERVFNILDIPTEKEKDKGKNEIISIKNKIMFDNVSFKYDAEGATILSSINFEVEKGSVIAFVGSSGAGKTTLLNLLPRFHEMSGGNIFIDDINIKDITLSSLRDQVGIVDQETILFDDTIKNNIAYGIEDANMEQIEKASKAAYAHQFIMNMPDGYDTFIGERGARISGGERQRIAIARALLKDPPILILDEATSSLDTESEYIIQKALLNLIKDRTTFVIAHRISTIQNASTIVVLDKGRIVETGKHDELIKLNGFYKKLYEMQFRERGKLVANE